MKVGILAENYPGERRVALVPANVTSLNKLGLEVLVQRDAGTSAGYRNSQYEEKGATLVDRGDALAADMVIGVRQLGANPEGWQTDRAGWTQGATLIGMCDPLGAAPVLQAAAEADIDIFALEMIPRITRAQSMDVLSSMATIAGYRAVLLSAVELPRMFPMLMTAAGTLTASRVFVIGAGVAGLQAIATAKRLGAIVQAYDVRPDCREQVESVGAKFVELELAAGQAEDQGGYAKQLGEEFYVRQRALMAEVVADSDVVITTAAIPGKQSPLLITADAVQGMRHGGVIVDLAAERGGNCELSQADQRVEVSGVTILGPTNLPSEIPYHASQMFSNNVTRFLQNMVKDGELTWDLDDEIVSGTLAVRDREVVHPLLRNILGLPDATATEPASNETPAKENAEDRSTTESDSA